MFDPFEFSLCLLLVVGPITGYIPQYLEIRRSRSAGGFSPLTSFILIASSVLRIMFWFLKRFETALLLQSIVMITAQVIMLELILRVKGTHSLPITIENKSSSSNNSNNSLSTSSSGSNINSNNSNNNNFTGIISILDDAFWETSNLKNYTSLATTTVILLANLVFLNLQFIHSDAITELFGYAALCLESTLAMPQFYRNYKSKSCAGLSLELVATWVFGDLFKTIMFISRNSPFPFIACGVIQLSVDFGVISQLYFYSGNKSPSA